MTTPILPTQPSSLNRTTVMKRRLLSVAAATGLTLGLALAGTAAHADPDNTKPVVGDLGTWVGKNPKGAWILKVVDNVFNPATNPNDGQILAWSVNVQTLSNKKVQVKGDLIVDGKITVLGAPSTTDGKCPGYLIDGVCVAESGAEQSFVNAAKWCANNFKADLCTEPDLGPARHPHAERECQLDQLVLRQRRQPVE